MEELFRLGAVPDPGGLFLFPADLTPPPSAGEGAASSGQTYGVVPKLEDARRDDPNMVRVVRASEKLRRLWNDMVDVGMLVQVDGRWVIDPTAAPTWPDGVTGSFS